MRTTGSNNDSRRGASSPAIELLGIDKHFGPVHANKDISLTVEPGTIHGIIGENGAGKSTLMSILYGYYQADKGKILVDGTERKIRSSHEALDAGIGMVHQHFMLVDNFSVLENIILGIEGGLLLKSGKKSARDVLLRLERDYGLEVDPDEIIENLPVGLQQRVEILKALYRGAEVLILDEPTGVLTPQEAEDLFRILGSLREQGKTIILITHKLKEIMAITDSVSVMRQGEMVAHRQTADTSREQLAELMVGRKVLFDLNKRPPSPKEVVLDVANIELVDHQQVKRLKGVSFQVHAGEVVGIAGVSGNGQSELLEVLSGIEPLTSGQYTVGKHTVSPQNPYNPAMIRAAGVAHVPEDRQRMGLITSFSASESAVLGHHNESRYNGSVLMNHKTMEEECKARMAHYDVRPQNPSLQSANFSGGNQQKLVLAREMEQNAKLLLVGQPTRGVDIGAIEFIHQRLIDMRDNGNGVLLVSVELDEILSVADRILVMFSGQIVGEVDIQDADEKTIGLLMAGAGLEEDAA